MKAWALKFVKSKGCDEKTKHGSLDLRIYRTRDGARRLAESENSWNLCGCRYKVVRVTVTEAK